MEWEGNKVIRVTRCDINDESFDTKDFVFHYNMPSNDKETIEIRWYWSIQFRNETAKNPNVNEIKLFQNAATNKKQLYYKPYYNNGWTIILAYS